MRAPIDPSEPLFPVRPNEPMCQYYVKHGTCKFGQACKFHHPPQAPLQAVINGGAVLMNVGGGGRKPDSPQLVLSPGGSDVNNGGGSMMLQFLPQRPEESDCIFFLKNGCCKYGATCRYHHPINYHQQRRAEETRRHRGPSHDVLLQQQQQQPQKVQYVSQVSPQVAGYQNKGVDNPVSFMNLEGSTAPQNYQIVTGNDGMSYYTPVGSGVVTEQGSVSSTSIASSFETAGSNLEQFASQGDVASAALWSRARKNGSGNSLSAYANDNTGRQGNRVPLTQSGSDGNIARRHRAASNGSASDHSQTYFEASPNSMSRSTSTGSWRNDSSMAYEQSKRMPMNQYGPSRNDGMPPNVGIHQDPRGGPPPSRGRPPTVGHRQQLQPQQRRRNPQGDEGFTMMTSALLNMLDTPEEAAGHYYLEDPSLHQEPFLFSEELNPETFEAMSLNNSRPDPRDYQASSEATPLNNSRPDPRHYQASSSSADSRWSPSWQPGGGPNDPGQTRGLQSRHGPPTHASNDPDVGLYLP